MTVAMKPRVTSLAPQFLVDDLERSMAYYRRLGFTFGEPWGNFYGIGCLDGLELHLKEAKMKRSVGTGATTSTSMRRQASMASKRSTSNAPPTALRFLSRSLRPHGVRKTSISRIRTATSFASASVPRLANMALQRTRRPRLRSGRSLRSLGSPLNAQPLGGSP